MNPLHPVGIVMGERVRLKNVSRYKTLRYKVSRLTTERMLHDPQN
jgi:hypothetical protein